MPLHECGSCAAARLLCVRSALPNHSVPESESMPSMQLGLRMFTRSQLLVLCSMDSGIMCRAGGGHDSVHPWLQAKELEERRRRRAELEAKLSAGGVAATAAAAPAEGVGQRGTRSPDAGSPHNGQHASDPGAALGGTDSGGQGAADAEAEPSSVAGEGEGAVEAQGRVTDGDDIVSMGSDAEEQQMEDLFRAAKQVWLSVPPGHTGQGGALLMTDVVGVLCAAAAIVSGVQSGRVVGLAAAVRLARWAQVEPFVYDQDGMLRVWIAPLQS